MTRKRLAKAVDLSEQTRQEIEEALSLFDSGKEDNGKVKIADLKIILRALGFEPRKDDIRSMTNALKPDADGEVDREKLIDAIAAKMSEKDSHEEMLRAFRLFDDDDTGTISFTNLKRAARELGETITDDELRDMITEADSSGKGEVSQEDFLKIMKQTCLY